MKNNTHWLLRPITALVGLLLIVLLNLWLFNAIADKNYFVWYLKNGTAISLATSFVGLLWKEMPGRKKLLSANPGKYLSGLMEIIRELFIAFSEWTLSIGKYFDIFIEMSRIKKAKKLGIKPEREIVFENSDEDYESSFGWDIFFSVISAILIFITTFAWIFIVSPLNYLVTIFSGAFTRVGELGKISYKYGDTKVVVEKDGKEVKFFRFSDFPFETTEAINALLLFIANIIYTAYIS